MYIRVTKVAFNAGTDATSSLHTAVGIRTTSSLTAWIRTFRNRRCKSWLGNRDTIAPDEWFASVTWKAGTHRRMIDDTAICIRATSSNAWINTFLFITCFCCGTVTVDDTLWVAVWWCTKKSR